MKSEIHNKILKIKHQFQNHSRERFHIRGLQAVQTRRLQQYNSIARRNLTGDAKSQHFIRKQ